MDLTPRSVRDINVDGCTVLDTSRGPQDSQEVVDCLERLGISILFVIGGDGTMRGAMQITSVINEREARIAVVGVPKTIDNDIPYLDQSFGFQTAFARATESIHAVTVEPKLLSTAWADVGFGSHRTADALRRHKARSSAQASGWWIG